MRRTVRPKFGRARRDLVQSMDMRRSGILVAWCIALAASTGCKADSDASSAPDPAALKAQQELIARRDALLAQRKKLAGERDKLSEEIKQVEAKGGDRSEDDTSELQSQ